LCKALLLDTSYDSATRKISVKSGGDPRLHVFETIVRERGIDLTGMNQVKIEKITVVDTLQPSNLQAID